MMMMMTKQFKAKELPAHQHVYDGEDINDGQGNHSKNEHQRRTNIVSPAYIPVSMRNNNSHPWPDMYPEDFLKLTQF